jgi:hypothetical protein
MRVALTFRINSSQWIAEQFRFHFDWGKNFSWCDLHAVPGAKWHSIPLNDILLGLLKSGLSQLSNLAGMHARHAVSHFCISICY